MNWGKRGALLMLAVVAMWAATPVSACLLMIPAGQPACCGVVAQGGSTRCMGMSSSCCQMRGSDPAVAPIPPYSPEHAQKLATAAHKFSVEPCAESGAGWRSVLKAPPPESSPGGISILRL